MLEVIEEKVIERAFYPRRSFVPRMAEPIQSPILAIVGNPP